MKITTYIDFLNEQKKINRPNSISLETAFKSVVSNANKVLALPAFKNIGIKLDDLIKYGFMVLVIENHGDDIQKSGISNTLKTNLRSGQGAIGVMQVKPETKKDMETRIIKKTPAPDEVLFNYDKCIYYGLVYLCNNYKTLSRSSNILRKEKTPFKLWRNCVLSYNMGTFREEKITKNSEVNGYLAKFNHLNKLEKFNDMVKDFSHKYNKPDYTPDFS